MPKPKPARYSIHIIDERGTPIPRSESKSRFEALSLADMLAFQTRREARVWNTQEGRYIYTTARTEAAHAA